MRVLYFCRDVDNRPSYFIKEQVDAIHNINSSIEICWCLCPHTGFFGWLKKLILLRRSIRKYKPTIIHAHNGVYGFIANLQRSVPVITTYHGSDIQGGAVTHMLSQFSVWLSAQNIFVSKSLQDQVVLDNKKSSIIPCGVNIDTFDYICKSLAREQLHLDSRKKYVLFSSHFTNTVKDPKLAFRVIGQIPNVEMLELKGKSRAVVNLLLNAVDAILLTSYSEGSPQIIKEAITVGTPIVSVKVGDVEQLLSKVCNAYIANTRQPSELVELLHCAMNMPHNMNGREIISNLNMDNISIAKQVLTVYNRI